ncbi:MAG: anion permease [Deltaproteobacteria bacterium]|jgi:phosphate/sulfate permease
MLELLGEHGLTTPHLVLLVVALLAACGFEFINGFHDTANAVATVIYTKTLKPQVAVLYSGLLNFCGVFLGGIAVALAIIKLLPVELLVDGGTGRGMAMVFALLVSAMLWNFGTWYLGLPASSSHTLIGSILGVGLASSLLAGHFGEGVNWGKAMDVGLSLLVSPLVGFGLAALVLKIMRAVVKDRRVFLPPDDTEKTPPRWVRAVLILTCGGVSFAHGSNDGQKGVGLIMLILVGLLPAQFALHAAATPEQMKAAHVAAQHARATFEARCPADPHACAAVEALTKAEGALANETSVAALSEDERWQVRQAVLLADDAAKNLDDTEAFAADRAALGGLTDYAPWWVLLMVALSLGIGTTVGWKRIVVTVGEKIGKSHLTYAQGASAELVAMSTIGFSSFLGLPVSTTHVLSSGIAGTMATEGSGIQAGTVKKIALAWILTLPASMLLAGVLFVVFEKLAS